MTDVLITGTVLTMDAAHPTAEAILVQDERLAAVGSREEVIARAGPNIRIIELGGACIMPGFVEAHGHAATTPFVIGPCVTDIRPVTLPSAAEVLETIRREIAARGAEGAWLNGWDGLLQTGLPHPDIAWLDSLAPETPLDAFAPTRDRRFS